MPIEETAMTPPFQELREMLEKATMGEWEANGHDTYDWGVPIIATDFPGTYGAPTNGMVAWATLSPVERDEEDFTRADANAALIVAAKNALPELLDRSDRLARIEQVDDDELLQRLIKAAELTNGLEVGRDCEEYSFARSPDFQAMTYNEDAFRALKALPEAVDTIRAQRARISELEGGITAAYQKVHQCISAPGDGKDGRERQLLREVGEILFPLSGYARAALKGDDHG